MHTCRLSIIDIGIDTTSKLTYSQHILSVSAEAVPPFCNYSSQILLTKYFTSSSHDFITFIRYVLEYSSPVWNPSTLESINELESDQRHITGRISSLWRLSYSERRAILDLQPLEIRRFHLWASRVQHKSDICNDLLAISEADNFKYSNHTSLFTRTGGSKLVKPVCNSHKIAKKT